MTTVMCEVQQGYQAPIFSAEQCVLIVDNETGFRQILTERLDQDGLVCLTAGSLAEALGILEQKSDAIKAVISEISLPDQTGIGVLDLVNDRELSCPVIFVTAYGTLEWAKQAIRAGAFEYYDKPVDLYALVQALRQAIRAGSAYTGPQRRLRPETGLSIVVESGGKDELTGLASHRFVLEKLSDIRKECINNGIPLSLCLLDIDKFHELNASRGLAVCDRILVETARRLRRLVRSSDLIGRYGSDEFLIVLPGTDGRGAQGLAERILANCRAEPVQIDGSKIRLRACIGVVEIDAGDHAGELEFIDRAIEAVYHAKLKGPESIVVWKPRLIPETSLADVDSEQSETETDAESISIMTWRFRELNRQLANVSLESLRVLVAAVEARDPYTKDHSVRVAAFSRCLAQEIDLPTRHVQIIHSAALLHDIGKIGIPDSILTKPGKLTDDEFELIRQHPDIAVSILAQTRFFTTELPLIKHHHERYDGTGYPDGLEGDVIPLGGRIIHLADAVEAMLARRSYKAPASIDYVLSQMREGMGSQFDPVLIEIAIALIRQDLLDRIWQEQPMDQQTVFSPMAARTAVGSGEREGGSGQ